MQLVYTCYHTKLVSVIMQWTQVYIEQYDNTCDRCVLINRIPKIWLFDNPGRFSGDGTLFVD